MSKKYWKDCYEYQRVLQILDDYWLSEKDELQVVIVMDFAHVNGETQSKYICWRNPEYVKEYENLKYKSAKEIMQA